MTAPPSPEIGHVLERAGSREELTRDEVELLLAVGSREEAEPLFTAARALREEQFGRRVFLYGFVYFSTYCRNWCTFCYYRRGNPESPRYRKSIDEVVAIGHDLAASGVHLLDLTMGEDPLIHDAPDFGALVDLVATVRREVGLPVMVSPGVVPDDVLVALAAAGADWYACYQETHTRDLYARLRVRQDYEERAAARGAAARSGLLVEDGILLGVGETIADRAASILEMRRQPLAQVRVMSFVPQPGTPLAGRESPRVLEEQVVIAVMRLVMPDRLIPASLDVEGIAGLEARLEAGANVVTSIVPPSSGLAGVSQAELDIDAGRRTVAGVVERLPALGLEAADAGEYAAWVSAARARQTAAIAV